MANIKLGNDVLTGVDTIKVTNADDETQKLNFIIEEQGYNLTLTANNNYNVTTCSYIIDDGSEVYFTRNMNVTYPNVKKIAFKGPTTHAYLHMDNRFQFYPSSGTVYDGLVLALVKDTMFYLEGSMEPE